MSSKYLFDGKGFHRKANYYKVLATVLAILTSELAFSQTTIVEPPKEGTNGEALTPTDSNKATQESSRGRFYLGGGLGARSGITVGDISYHLGWATQVRVGYDFQISPSETLGVEIMGSNSGQKKGARKLDVSETGINLTYGMLVNPQYRVGGLVGIGVSYFDGLREDEDSARYEKCDWEHYKDHDSEDWCEKDKNYSAYGHVKAGLLGEYLWRPSHAFYVSLISHIPTAKVSNSTVSSSFGVILGYRFLFSLPF